MRRQSQPRCGEVQERTDPRCQQAAARIGFDLRYSASPKWLCYEALLRMGARLRDELSALGAADFIDVQTFMWVTRGLE